MCVGWTWGRSYRRRSYPARPWADGSPGRGVAGALRRLWGNNVAVATASAVQTSAAHAPVARPNMASVGTIVWLSSELMFFAGLFAMYFTLRSVVPEQWVSGPEKLNVPFSTANTLVLVISSVWCQLGVLSESSV